MLLPLLSKSLGQLIQNHDMHEKSGISNGLLRDKISLKKLFFFLFVIFQVLFKTLYNNIFVLRGVIFAIFFHIKSSFSREKSTHSGI